MNENDSLSTIILRSAGTWTVWARTKSGEIRVSLAPFRCQLVRVNGI